MKLFNAFLEPKSTWFFSFGSTNFKPLEVLLGILGSNQVDHRKIQFSNRAKILRSLRSSAFEKTGEAISRVRRVLGKTKRSLAR